MQSATRATSSFTEIQNLRVHGMHEHDDGKGDNLDNEDGRGGEFMCRRLKLLTEL